MGQVAGLTRASKQSRTSCAQTLDFLVICTPQAGHTLEPCLFKLFTHLMLVIARMWTRSCCSFPNGFCLFGLILSTANQIVGTMDYSVVSMTCSLAVNHLTSAVDHLETLSSRCNDLPPHFQVLRPLQATLLGDALWIFGVMVCEQSHGLC